MIAKDSSGNGHDGTYFGTAVFVPGMVPGDLAVDFSNGTPGSSVGGVTVGYSALSWAHDFSLEVWMQDPFVAAAQSYLLGISDSVSGRGVFLSYVGGGPGELTVADNAFFSGHTAAGVPPADGLRHHIVFVNTAGTPNTFQFYVDGVPVTTTTSPPVTATTMDTTGIGCQYPPTPGSQVAQDEAAIYTYALSAGQVAAHYAARATFSAYSAAVLADGPDQYYHLDDGPSSSGWYLGQIGMAG